jgi:hypothetical protein
LKATEQAQKIQNENIPNFGSTDNTPPEKKNLNQQRMDVQISEYGKSIVNTE